MVGGVLLTLGHGYSARALAASAPEGWHILGTTRSRERAAALRADGVEPVDWGDARAVGVAIRAASHLLVSAAPDAGGGPAGPRS